MEFRGQMLSDPSAFPEPPLSGKLTWNVTQPWSEPGDDKERAAKKRAQKMIERLKKKQGLDNNLHETKE